MKFSSIVAAFVATMTSFPLAAVAQTSVAPVTVTAQDDEALTPVRISVRCPGVDFSKFSLSSGAFVGNILETSYNEVVDNDEADDSALSDVSFTGSSSSGKFAKTGEWKGSWDCDKCVKDTNDETKQWAQAFVAALKASNDEELRVVKSCTIVMGPGLPSKEENALRNAEIQVDCGKNVDMKSLTVAQGTVLARAIQHTYNTVHEKNPDDDSYLENVVYSAAVKTQYDDVESTSGLTRRRYPGNLGLMHICRLCPKDDDLSYGVEVSGANLMAWQAELAALLRQSSVLPFRKIKKCTIKVLPYEAVDSEQEEVEEPRGGVRGGCAIQ